MKKFTIKTILFCTLLPTVSFAQMFQKVWYDGNSRAMFYRDALTGDLKDSDTTSTRSEGEGYTAIDLGMHFTPNEEIEIFSEIRVKNDFGYMWGAGAYVDLRRLSIKGVLNNRVSFNIGDMYLKQTDFTLNNFNQELSKYEPNVFQAYKDLIDYENFYMNNYWRMQGLQSNFSYTFYNSIESVEADLFASRVRGVQWLGEPELLMLGGTSIIKLENNISIGVNYVNSFEVQSSSLDTATYYNPVTNLQLKYKKRAGGLKYFLSIDFGGSSRGWNKNNGGADFETSGGFLRGKTKVVAKNFNSTLGFKYISPEFRSAGAQTRRVNFMSVPSSYAYYTNNTILRPVSMMDIITDPNIYNHRLSTSLMQYNILYSAVLPYGEATPNRVGGDMVFNYKNNNSSLLASADIAYFQEVIGQGTTQRRSLVSSGLSLKANIDKLIGFDNKTQLELSIISEGVTRGGDEIESISFNSSLVSAGLSYELFENLKIIGGTKSFTGSGNEVGVQRDEYDQIIGFELLDFNSKENIMLIGLQYNFTKDIYFSLQTNKIDFDDKTSETEKLSLNRIYFMFNMNL